MKICETRNWQIDTAIGMAPVLPAFKGVEACWGKPSSFSKHHNQTISEQADDMEQYSDYEEDFDTLIFFLFLFFPFPSDERIAKIGTPSYHGSTTIWTSSPIHITVGSKDQT